MAKHNFIHTDALKKGMVVKRAVKDHYGNTLIEDGVILDDILIYTLTKLGIDGVYICDADNGEERFDDFLDEIASEQIYEKIREVRVEDPKTVVLSESVKKRVEEGIRYIFNTEHEEEIADTADNITSELMRVISENKAVAIDVEILKVSDEYTFKHSVDVATISMIIAKKYGLSNKEIYELGITGLLHDVGKAKVPNEILNKPARLTDEEYSIIKKHSAWGFDILKKRKNVSDNVLYGVLQHHEKINGKGYPLGLKKEQICLYAKIVSIADIYDALVTERPYKKAYSQRDAIEMLMAMTNEVDIHILKSFLRSVILYPVDSIVRLSNGESARVVENHEEAVLRPTVVGLQTGKIYNLAEDMECASIVIQ